MIKQTESALPVYLLTGFLGSGKTTLLSHLLKDARLADTAVVINEFGEIGLDHHLVCAASENVVVLESGCVCCSLSDDLVGTLRELHERRRCRQIPRFSRVVIETTGLSDPRPIVRTLLSEESVRRHYAFAGVVTVVDAVFGAAQLDGHPEAMRQAAMADCLVLSKADLAGGAAVAALRETLGRINPRAACHSAARGVIDPRLIFDACAGAVHGGAARFIPAAGAGRHTDGIATVGVRLAAPVDWAAFEQNLAAAVRDYADRLLRLKGLVAVAGASRPRVVHGVHGLLHDAGELEGWPDEDRTTRLVFILQDADAAQTEALRRRFAPDA